LRMGLQSRHSARSRLQARCCSKRWLLVVRQLQIERYFGGRGWPTKAVAESAQRLSMLLVSNRRG
jgi:hypothetical protein